MDNAATSDSRYFYFVHLGEALLSGSSNLKFDGYVFDLKFENEGIDTKNDLDERI